MQENTIISEIDQKFDQNLFYSPHFEDVRTPGLFDFSAMVIEILHIL